MIGEVVTLEGEPFGVVVRAYASTAAPWAFSQGFRGGVRLGRVVEIAPYELGAWLSCAYVREDGDSPAIVLGFVVPRVGKERGRELVIVGRSRSTPRSAKSRKRSTR